MPIRRAALAVAAALLLAGCAPAAAGVTATPTSGAVPPLSELVVPADPRSIEGPSTALIADAAVPVVEGEWPQRLPATVASRDPQGGDTEVVVEAADRIIAMDIAGSVAATVAGLGLVDRLVGRDVSTSFPGTEDLPVITSNGHTVNGEAIIALSPDLVITDGTIGPIDVVQQLRDAGIDVVFVENESSFEGVAELARQVGAAVGMPEAGEALAEQLATSIEAEVAEIAAILPPAAPLRMAFLYLRGGSGIYYLFGEGSGAEVLIESLGGIDVAAEIGLEGSKPMTDEALIAAQPELILVMTKGIESVGGIDGLLEAQPAVGLTPAGERRRFVDMADAEILSFGPRTAAVLDALARAIYAP